MNKGIKCKFMMEGRFILREILGELATVQPCSFLPAYCGQEACSVRLMETPSKKRLWKQIFNTFLPEIFARLNCYHINVFTGIPFLTKPPANIAGGNYIPILISIYILFHEEPPAPQPVLRSVHGTGSRIHSLSLPYGRTLRKKDLRRAHRRYRT